MILQHMKFSAYSVEKLVAYLAVATGFFGVTLLPVDLGLVTLFPYRIFLLLLWLLFVVHVLTGGERSSGRRTSAAADGHHAGSH